MAFIQKNLSVLCTANGFTLWHYKTEGDAADTVRALGYFNAGDAPDFLRPGDMILLNAADAHGTLVVSRNEPGLPLLVDPAVFDLAGAR